MRGMLRRRRLQLRRCRQPRLAGRELRSAHPRRTRGSAQGHPSPARSWRPNLAASARHLGSWSLEAGRRGLPCSFSRYQYAAERAVSAPGIIRVGCCLRPAVGVQQEERRSGQGGHKVFQPGRHGFDNETERADVECRDLIPDLMVSCRAVQQEASGPGQVEPVPGTPTALTVTMASAVGASTGPAGTASTRSRASLSLSSWPKGSVESRPMNRVG